MSLAQSLLMEASRTEDPEARSRLVFLGSREALREDIRACTACPLYRTVAQPVPFSGPASDVVFVGEAPGADEDRLGEPFVGRSGRLLRELIAEHTRIKSPAFVNTICCRPAGNDYAVARAAGAPIACRPLFDRQLALSGAWLAVALGAHATQALHPGGPSRVRQGPFWGLHGLGVISTYHPAYALRKPDAVADIAADLARMQRVLDGVQGEFPPPIAAPVGPPLTRPLHGYEAQAWNQHLVSKGWAIIWSNLLGEQLVIVRDDTVVPPPKAEGVRWTLPEIRRMNAYARRGEFTWKMCRMVNEMKRQFDGSEVVA